MRAIFQKKVALVVLTVFVFVVIVICCGFSVMLMGSGSMQPVITGQGMTGYNAGDLVVVAKWFRVDSLRTGDLVAVDIPTPSGRVRTVRRIEQQADTPAGKFYLRAASDNGIDSRQFGPLPASDIRGKVIWILR